MSLVPAQSPPTLGHAALMAHSQAPFAAALESLWMAYQPIIDCQSGRLYGYEALVRSREPSLTGPHALFAAAEAAQQSVALGRQIRRQVAVDVLRLPLPDACYLFVNLHARDLLDETLFDPRAPLSQHAERVVFEITEREALESVVDLGLRIARLRALGFRIALDDLGAGFAGLSTLADLGPEVVKLDMSLVREVHINERKRTIIECLVELCRRLNVHLIAEGVETQAERDLLAQLGCRWLQGYYFGRPQPEFAPPSFF